MTKRLVVAVGVFLAASVIFIVTIRSAMPQQPTAAVSPTPPVPTSSVQNSRSETKFDGSNWKIYSDAEVGTFKYPTDWKVSEDSSNGTALLVEIYPISGGIDDPQALVIWIGGPYGNETMEQTTRFFKNLVSDFEQTSTTVAGIAATKLEGIQNTQSSGPQPYNGQTVTWVLVPPGGINRPFYQFRGNDDNPVFDQILSTFVFSSR